MTDEKREQYYAKVSRVSLHQNELGILIHILGDAIEREQRRLADRNGLNPDRLNALKRLEKKMRRNWTWNFVSFEDFRNYVPHIKS